MEGVVVVGGGWAGCAAALAASKTGLAVTLLERTDRLLASGLVGGIMRNNGRFTAAEELKLMGAGELIKVADAAACHRNLDFPGHRHASLYDVERVELPVERLLQRHGVRLLRQHRAVDVITGDSGIEAVKVARGEGGETLISGDCFIDASGTAGPQANCRRFGNGCAMCIYRCPTFGPRVSISVRAGAHEKAILRQSGAPGYFSGSCELEPTSLSPPLRRRIREDGLIVIPLPPGAFSEQKELMVQIKACRQYSSETYSHNLILLDTGAVKMMVPYLPLPILRRLKGFERAIFRDPLGGSRGNSIRFSGLIERDGKMMVPPLKNLFVAGERAGLSLGHTEAIVTGTLAGYNAQRLLRGRELLELPRSTACGEMIAFTAPGNLPGGAAGVVYSLSGGPLWERLQRHKLYSTDRRVIARRLRALGLLQIFGKP